MIKKIILLCTLAHITTHGMQDALWEHGYNLSHLATIPDTFNPSFAPSQFKKRYFFTDNVIYNDDTIGFTSQIMYDDPFKILPSACKSKKAVIFLGIATGICTYRCNHAPGIDNDPYLVYYDPYRSGFRPWPSITSYQQTTQEILLHDAHDTDYRTDYGMTVEAPFGPPQYNLCQHGDRKHGAYILINDIKHPLCMSHGSTNFGLTSVHLKKEMALGCIEKQSLTQFLWNRMNNWSYGFSPERTWYLFKPHISDDTYYDKPTPICIMKPMYAIPELDTEDVQNLMFTKDGKTIIIFLYDGRILKITPKIPKRNLYHHHKPHDVVFNWK